MFRGLSNNEMALINKHLFDCRDDLKNAILVSYEFEARLNDEPIFDVFVRRTSNQIDTRKKSLTLDVRLDEMSLDDLVAAMGVGDKDDDKPEERHQLNYRILFGDEANLSPVHRRTRIKFLNSSRYRRVRFQWRIDSGDIKNIDDLNEIAIFLLQKEKAVNLS